MPEIVQRGPYKGHVIRKARKEHRCENRSAALAGNARGCHKTIKANAYYIETEVDPYNAGGFGMSKLCMGCAGLEAQATTSAQAQNQLDLQDARRFGLADEYGRFDRQALREAMEREGSSDTSQS